MNVALFTQLSSYRYFSSLLASFASQKRAFTVLFRSFDRLSRFQSFVICPFLSNTGIWCLCGFPFSVTLIASDESAAVILVRLYGVGWLQFRATSSDLQRLDVADLLILTAFSLC